MRRAIITVGLGFGDEGKGSAVDYLSRKHGADLVVRYNGGHQAGHNVVLPDGTHHCFHQFGAGTFAGVPTYLGRHMIVSPDSLHKEASELHHKGVTNPAGMVTINFDCLITTPWHALLNQMKEIKRAGKAHGSCGVGVGETRKYWIDHGRDAVTAQDVVGDFNTLVDKLEVVRQRLILDAQEVVDENNHNKLNAMYKISPKQWALQASSILMHFTFSNALPKFTTAVFEGAQGVLLDEYYGFYPHTTWSTTTSRHAIEEFGPGSGVDVEVVGITRTYHTRHGNGPFPTYDMHMSFEGEHNQTNEWQSDFRFGKLDLPLLRYALDVDGEVDSLFVSCWDHTDDGVISYVPEYKWNPYDYGMHHLETPDKTMLNQITPTISANKQLGAHLNIVQPATIGTDDATEVFKAVGYPISYRSNGPTYKDKITCS